MIAELQAIACLLTSDPLSTDEVVGKLGSVAHDYGGNVLVRPYDPQFKEVSVVRRIDLKTFEPTNIPSGVGLIPVHPPPVEKLVQAFGKAKRLAYNRHLPQQIIIHLNMPGQPYTVALIAQVKYNRAIRITLRRDKETLVEKSSVIWRCR